eukprot:TCONS_00013796-protein
MALYLIMISCLQIYFAFSKTDQFTITRRNKQLRGYNLVSKYNVNKPIECVFECQNYRKCQSINYHSGQQICQLNKIVSQTLRDVSLAHAIGWQYFEKKEDVEVSNERYFYITEETKPERNKLLNIIPLAFSHWTLSMDITPRAFPQDGPRNILHMISRNESSDDVTTIISILQDGGTSCTGGSP